MQKFCAFLLITLCYSVTSSNIEGAIGNIFNSYKQQAKVQVEEPQCLQSNFDSWLCRLVIDGQQYSGEGTTKKISIMQAQKRFLQSDSSFWQEFVLEMLSTDYYTFGQVFEFPESQTIEFKGNEDANIYQSFKNFKWSLTRELGQFVCAALNDEENDNHYIYFGIHDTGAVQGVDMPNDGQDKVSLIWENQIKNSFYPLLQENNVQYSFIPVKETTCKTCFVVRFHIRQSKKYKLFWYNGVVYQRNGPSTQKMSPETIKNRIAAEVSSSTKQRLATLRQTIGDLLV